MHSKGIHLIQRGFYARYFPLGGLTAAYVVCNPYLVAVFKILENTHWQEMPDEEKKGEREKKCKQ